ncbi:MAG: hypothetical protein AB1782_09450 [Cyanobacteriota bacterium]
MAEWWFILCVVAVIVMFTLLTWGDVTNEIMNKLKEALTGVNSNIGSTVST